MKKLERFTTTPLPRDFYSRCAFWEAAKPKAQQTRDLFEELGRLKSKIWNYEPESKAGLAAIKRVNDLEDKLGLTNTTIPTIWTREKLRLVPAEDASDDLDEERSEYSM